MNFRIWTAAFLLVLTSACADDSFDAAPSEHDEPADLVLVTEFDGKGDEVLSTFDKNFIVTDTFYEDAQAVDGDDIQAFLENSPYGTRSWLADERVDGVRAADLIASAAQAENINPIMLLVRLQVEQALVSKTARPTQTRINRALGCGCYDGSSCASAYRGFEKQMRCGAQTHRNLFTESQNNGQWAAGKTTRTSDRIYVKPSNHATAALYGYTPWVLQGRGGNWLVWNISKKFLNHFVSLGHYHVRPVPWIGSACVNDSECAFTADGESGFCNMFDDVDGTARGFCTIACQGFCPDRDGRASTFCIEASPSHGMCASKAEELNRFCETIPGTVETERARFIGSSSASASTAAVCVP